MMKKKKELMIRKNYNIVPFVAIIGLVVIECIALHNGINGKLMTVVVGAIAGIGGWTLPQLITR